MRPPLSYSRVLRASACICVKPCLPGRAPRAAATGLGSDTRQRPMHQCHAGCRRVRARCRAAAIPPREPLSLPPRNETAMRSRARRACSPRLSCHGSRSHTSRNETSVRRRHPSTCRSSLIHRRIVSTTTERDASETPAPPDDRRRPATPTPAAHPDARSVPRGPPRRTPPPPAAPARPSAHGASPDRFPAAGSPALPGPAPRAAGPAAP